MSSRIKRERSRSSDPKTPASSQRDANTSKSDGNLKKARFTKRGNTSTPFESARDRKMRKRAAAHNGTDFRTNREQIALLKEEKDELRVELERSEEKRRKLEERNQSLEKGENSITTDDENQRLILEKHKSMILNRLVNGYDHAATKHAEYIRTLLDDFGAKYDLGVTRLGVGGSRYGGVDFVEVKLDNMDVDAKNAFYTKYTKEVNTYENNDQSIPSGRDNFRADGKRSTSEVTNRHDDLLKDSSQKIDENNNRNHRSDSE